MVGGGSGSHWNVQLLKKMEGWVIVGLCFENTNHLRILCSFPVQFDIYIKTWNSGECEKQHTITILLLMWWCDIIRGDNTDISLTRQTASLVWQWSSQNDQSLAGIVKLRQRDSVTIRRSAQLSDLTSFDRSALSLLLSCLQNFIFKSVLVLRSTFNRAVNCKLLSRRRC